MRLEECENSCLYWKTFLIVKLFSRLRYLFIYGHLYTCTLSPVQSMFIIVVLVNRAVIPDYILLRYIEY